jgi:hypothetical protein
MKKVILALASVLLISSLVGICTLAQNQTKPSIASIKIESSEPIPPGTCTVSTAGYWGKNGRTVPTSKELGEFVTEFLGKGYTITIYPRSKRGIFVTLGRNKGYRSDGCEKGSGNHR